LPQGEFRKLLTSETENKEDILRRLFKTEQYKHMSERLRAKKQAVEEVFQQEVHARDHYVQTILATLPKREDAHIVQVLGEEHYNMNQVIRDRKSTRLNSSHVSISYAVFCLKKK